MDRGTDPMETDPTPEANSITRTPQAAPQDTDGNEKKLSLYIYDKSKINIQTCHCRESFLKYVEYKPRYQ